MTYLTVGGETRPVEEWARITGIRDDLIRSRIRRGWAPEEVIGRRDRKRPGRKAGAVRVTRLEVDGESHTVAEWAAMTGISAGLIRSRLRRGLLPGVAIQGGRLPGTGKSVKRVLDADKVTAIRKDTRSYKAIAEQYGISLATVGHIKKRQTWKHVDDDDPEGTGLPEHTNLKPAPTQLVADGESHTIAEWAKIRNISKATIRSRLKRGLSPEEAIHPEPPRAPRRDRRRVGSPNAKVTPEQALAIRDDPRILRVIAEQYGISVAAVHSIKKGRSWKHAGDVAAPDHD